MKTYYINFITNNTYLVFFIVPNEDPYRHSNFSSVVTMANVVKGKISILYKDKGTYLLVSLIMFLLIQCGGSKLFINLEWYIKPSKIFYFILYRNFEKDYKTRTEASLVMIEVKPPTEGVDTKRLKPYSVT